MYTCLQICIRFYLQIYVCIKTSWTHTHVFMYHVSPANICIFSHVRATMCVCIFTYITCSALWSHISMSIIDNTHQFPRINMYMYAYLCKVSKDANSQNRSSIHTFWYDCVYMRPRTRTNTTLHTITQVDTTHMVSYVCVWAFLDCSRIDVYQQIFAYLGVYTCLWNNLCSCV